MWMQVTNANRTTASVVFWWLCVCAMNLGLVAIIFWALVRGLIWAIPLIRAAWNQ